MENKNIKCHVMSCLFHWSHANQIGIFFSQRRSFNSMPKDKEAKDMKPCTSRMTIQTTSFLPTLILLSTAKWPAVINSYCLHMIIITNDRLRTTVWLVERKILKYTGERIQTSWGAQSTGFLFVGSIELTFWSGVPPEKIIAAQLVKKFHEF
jgi:hypothetical protein